MPQFLEVTLNILGIGKKRVMIEKGCSFENNANIYHVNNDCKLSIFDKATKSWADSNEITMTSYQFDTFKAVHDIITNEENGIIVSQLSLESYAEKLENLMLDDLRLQRMAENGIETCKRFSVSKVVDKWQSIFKELVPEL